MRFSFLSKSSGFVECILLVGGYLNKAVFARTQIFFIRNSSGLRKAYPRRYLRVPPAEPAEPAEPADDIPTANLFKTIEPIQCYKINLLNIHHSTMNLPYREPVRSFTRSGFVARS